MNSRAAVWVGVAVVGLVVTGACVLVAGVGWGNADQVASVVSAVIGMFSLVATLVGIRMTMRAFALPDVAWQPEVSTCIDGTATNTLASYAGPDRSTVGGWLVSGHSDWRIPPENLIGREQTLLDMSSRLERHLASGLGDGGARPLVMAVSGMAGVGKTALLCGFAVRVHGDFPDGVFYADMNGYSPAAGGVESRQVLRSWLAKIKPGVPLPDTESELTSLLAEVLATKRALLLVDNVASERQAIPLLPRVGASVAVMAGRDRLDGLAAVGNRTSWHLATLDPSASERLLTDLIGDYASTAPSAVARLVEYCAGLPLALVIAGSGLGARVRDGASLTGLVDQFDIERDRLERFHAAPDHGVRMSFSWTYRSLDQRTRQAFRLLGLHMATGSTIDSYIAGALFGHTSTDADRTLTTLEKRGLLSFADTGSTAVRYRMHDLVRLYAAERIADPRHARQRHEALHRLTLAYYGCVNFAFNLQNNGNRMVDTEYLTRWENSEETGPASVLAAGSAVAWFERERLNLLNTVRAAATALPPPDYTAKLATSLFYFLEIGDHTDDWAEMEQIAAEVATASGDRHDRARSLRNRSRLILNPILASIDLLTTDGTLPDIDRSACREAIILLEESLNLYRAGDSTLDASGVVTVLRELGDAYRLLHDPTSETADTTHVDTAQRMYAEAEQHYTALDSANGLNSLALAQGTSHLLSDPSDSDGSARRRYEHSLAYAAAHDDQGRPLHPRLAVYAHLRLAKLDTAQGDQDNAIDHYTQAAAILRQHVTNDHMTLARVLALLGRLTPDSTEAKNHLTEAMTILKAKGARHEIETHVVQQWLEQLR